MAKVTINENTCKGCELCTTACPKHIISLAKDKLNLKGYHPACVTNPDECIGMLLWDGGDSRDRTGDLLLARQALSQLSYIPKLSSLPADFIACAL